MISINDFFGHKECQSKCSCRIHFPEQKNPPLNTNPNPSFHKEYVRKCANEACSVVLWRKNGIKWSNFSQTYSIAYRSGKKILHSGFQKETKLQYRQVIGFFKQILWKTTKIVAVTLKKLLHKHRNLKKERGKTDRPPPSTNSAWEEPEHRAMTTTASLREESFGLVRIRCP